MHTLYYTKEFTTGSLKGMRFSTSVTFTDMHSLRLFVKKGRGGFKKSATGPGFKIVDCSFQNYQR